MSIGLTFSPLPLAIVALVTLALTGCVTTAPIARDLAYLEQVPPRQDFASPLAVAQSLIGDYPETLEADPTIDLEVVPHPETPERLLLTVRIDPVLDDSIAAEQWRATLRPVGEGWRIEALGLRRKCSRGSNIDEWGPFICP